MKGIAIQLPLVQEQRPGAQGMGGSTFDGTRHVKIINIIYIILISNHVFSCRGNLYNRQVGKSVLLISNHVFSCRTQISTLGRRQTESLVVVPVLVSGLVDLLTMEVATWVPEDGGAIPKGASAKRINLVMQRRPLNIGKNDLVWDDDEYRGI